MEGDERPRAPSQNESRDECRASACTAPGNVADGRHDAELVPDDCFVLWRLLGGDGVRRGVCMRAAVRACRAQSPARQTLTMQRLWCARAQGLAEPAPCVEAWALVIPATDAPLQSTTRGTRRPNTSLRTRSHCCSLARCARSQVRACLPATASLRACCSSAAPFTVCARCRRATRSARCWARPRRWAVCRSWPGGLRSASATCPFPKRHTT